MSFFQGKCTHDGDVGIPPERVLEQVREFAVPIWNVPIPVEYQIISGGRISSYSVVQIKARTHGLRDGSDSASMTVPKAKRLRLMYFPSAIRSISDTAFSLPARSIKVYESHTTISESSRRIFASYADLPTLIASRRFLPCFRPSDDRDDDPKISPLSNSSQFDMGSLTKVKTQ